MKEFFLLLSIYIISIKCTNSEINETIFNYIHTGKYKEMENYLDSLKEKNITFKTELISNIENKIKELNNIFTQFSKLDSSNKKNNSPSILLV